MFVTKCTGAFCACKLINTHIHTHTHAHPPTHTHTHTHTHIHIYIYIHLLFSVLNFLILDISDAEKIRIY